jgi:ATP synthase protein I
LDKPTEKQKLAAYSTVGLMFPSSIAIGAVIGFFLDKWWHTTPWMLIIFTLYGVVAGFVNLYQVIRKYDGK